jgi:hypothetical protein
VAVSHHDATLTVENIEHHIGGHNPTGKAASVSGSPPERVLTYLLLGGSNQGSELT